MLDFKNNVHKCTRLKYKLIVCYIGITVYSMPNKCTLLKFKLSVGYVGIQSTSINVQAWNTNSV